MEWVQTELKLVSNEQSSCVRKEGEDVVVHHAHVVEGLVPGEDVVVHNAHVVEGLVLPSGVPHSSAR